MPRGWNSTGPPRASTMATPYIEPRIRDGNDMIGSVIMIFDPSEAAATYICT